MKCEKGILFFAFFLMCVVTKAQDYLPPTGIPAPEFGINETVDNTYGVGYYTHYVDAGHTQSTDVGNPNGTPTQPRATIPQSLGPGSVVEVHGGPYEVNLSNLQGTSSAPIFIRGEDSSNRFTINNISGGSYNVINTSYLILEYATFFEEPIQIGQNTDHVSIRYCDIDGNDNTTGLALWTNRSSYQEGELKTHIVLYQNEIHDCGLYPASAETNRHGIIIDNASSQVWILENHIYENGDDGIQIIDRNWVPEVADVEADHIYIGGNVIHHDGENGIDAKGCEDLIISENEIYGYETIFNSSRGEAIRINDEGAQDNIWIVNNHIYDSEQAINPLQSLFRPYIIGNVIHDCSDYGVNIDAGWLINNTIYNTGIAIAEGESGVVNNIIVNASIGSILAGNNVHHNLRWNAPVFDVPCNDCLSLDPLLTNPSGQDFSLQEGSPAIDAYMVDGTIEAIFNEFTALYGEDIRKDINQTVRPIGAAWDMGALEYSGALPALFGAFYGESTKTDNILFWETESEDNNRGFEIEYSKDSREWRSIGIVEGQGTVSSTQAYTWIHASPESSVSFYRLKQLDFDGSFIYSPIIMLTRQAALTEVTVFPNPAQQFVHYSLTNQENVTSVQLLDMLGKVIRETKEIQGKMSLQGIPKGVYHLVLQGSFGQVVKPLVVSK